METKLGRVFVQEPVLLTEKANHILDYEKATHIIEEAEHIGVGICYCRHKNLHLGISCRQNAPLETCLTFDNIARSLSEHGCCCECLGAARKFSPMQPIETTNYLPEIQTETCISCGKCSRVCPILAISMKEKRPVIDKDICLGCGVCARNCPTKAIILKRRPVQVITPVNSTHRFVLQAIEMGTLQNLVFDNQAFASHRAMAAVFGTILKLPPLKQAMAGR